MLYSLPFCDCSSESHEAIAFKRKLQLASQRRVSSHLCVTEGESDANVKMGCFEKQYFTIDIVKKTEWGSTIWRRLRVWQGILSSHYNIVIMLPPCMWMSVLPWQSDDWSLKAGHSCSALQYVSKAVWKFSLSGKGNIRHGKYIDLYSEQSGQCWIYKSMDTKITCKLYAWERIWVRLTNSLEWLDKWCTCSRQARLQWWRPE